MNLIFRPLDMWTDLETQNRKPAPFFTSWTDTLKLLDREIDTLTSGNKHHTDVVLQVAAPESAMRLDGGIRAGVIITFDGPSGPMRFATDHFESSSKWKSGGGTTYYPAWQNNVRAIALALEALRKVNRYGVGQGNEQYVGWKQLGPGIEMPAAQMTADEALEFLRVHAGWAYGPDHDDPEDIDRAYRQAAKRLHPDAGGTTADFQRLQGPGGYSMESGHERYGEARRGDNRNGRPQTIRERPFCRSMRPIRRAWRRPSRSSSPPGRGPPSPCQPFAPCTRRWEVGYRPGC